MQNSFVGMTPGAELIGCREPKLFCSSFGVAMMRLEQGRFRTLLEHKFMLFVGGFPLVLHPSLSFSCLTIRSMPRSWRMHPNKWRRRGPRRRPFLLIANFPMIFFTRQSLGKLPITFLGRIYPNPWGIYDTLIWTTIYIYTLHIPHTIIKHIPTPLCSTCLSEGKTARSNRLDLPRDGMVQLDIDICTLW